MNYGYLILAVNKYGNLIVLPISHIATAGKSGRKGNQVSIPGKGEGNEINGKSHGHIVYCFGSSMLQRVLPG